MLKGKMFEAILNGCFGHLFFVLFEMRNCLINRQKNEKSVFFRGGVWYNEI